MSGFRRSARATSLLHHWDGVTGWTADAQPITVDLRVGTLTRASIATAIGSDGRPYVAARGKPALTHWYNPTTGLWEPQGPILRAIAVTNLAKQSESLGTSPWTDIATPTWTAATKRIGCVVLGRLGADSSDGKAQPMTWTGDGVKAVSLFVSRVAVSYAPVRIIVQDTTAAAARLNFVASFSSADPASLVVSGATGTNLLEHLAPKAERCVDEFGQAGWRLHLQTTAVTAANDHELRIIMVLGGEMDVGGVQCEDAPHTGCYVKTVAAAQTREVDALEWAWARKPGDSTLYVDARDFGTMQTAGQRLVQLGDNDAGTSKSARLAALANGDLRLTYDNGTVDEDADVTSGAVLLADRQQVRAVVTSTSLVAGRAINGAAEVSASGTPITHPDVYGEAVLSLTPNGASGHAVRSCKVAAASMTIAALEAAS